MFNVQNVQIWLEIRVLKKTGDLVFQSSTYFDSILGINDIELHPQRFILVQLSNYVM